MLIYPDPCKFEETQESAKLYLTRKLYFQHPQILSIL